MRGRILVTIIATFIVLIVGFFIYQSIHLSSYDDYDPVMEWYWAEYKLSNYEDIGYGHAGVLDDIWLEANYGKKVNLDWYENYRLKYNLNSVPSFYLINYNNSCPREPSLKYIGTGYIVNFSDSNYKNQPYSKTIISINGTNRTFYNCRWNPYQYNKTHLTYVFRSKNDPWWNNFKEATLFDATIYPDKPEKNNQSWLEYSINYQKYLDAGGVNINSEYYNRDWDLHLEGK